MQKEYIPPTHTHKMWKILNKREIRKKKRQWGISNDFSDCQVIRTKLYISEPLTNSFDAMWFLCVLSLGIYTDNARIHTCV